MNDQEAERVVKLVNDLVEFLHPRDGQYSAEEIMLALVNTIAVNHSRTSSPPSEICGYFIHVIAKIYEMSPVELLSGASANLLNALAQAGDQRARSVINQLQARRIESFAERHRHGTIQPRRRRS